MSKISIYTGGLLSIIGVLSYVTTGFEHITALFPLFMGAPIAVCGILTQKQPDKAKIYMHVAVTLSLLGFLACVGRLVTMEDGGLLKNASLWSMMVICFILTGLYVQSFLKARMNKQG